MWILLHLPRGTSLREFRAKWRENRYICFRAIWPGIPEGWFLAEGGEESTPAAPQSPKSQNREANQVAAPSRAAQLELFPEPPACLMED